MSGEPRTNRRGFAGLFDLIGDVELLDAAAIATAPPRTPEELAQWCAAGFQAKTQS